MTSDLLRQAATVLRERADAATPGPWRTDVEIDGVHAGSRTVVRAGVGYRSRVVSVGQTRPHHSKGEASAAYIATMHPGVGHALADWLDNEASIMGDHLAALTVARAVLGEQP
jgi:hypothetical protein